MTDQDKTRGEQEQVVPGSADHEPLPATEEAKAMHGDQARGEVFDQPESVELPAGTLIATEAPDPQPNTGERKAR